MQRSALLGAHPQINCCMQAIGVDLETIKYIVGHADIDMTEHYLRLQKSKINQAMDLFGTEFGVTEE